MRPFGNRTPGNNRYRCFLSDLAGLAARPPSGSRYAYEAMVTIAGEEDAVNRQGKGPLRPGREGEAERLVRLLRKTFFEGRPPFCFCAAVFLPKAAGTERVRFSPGLLPVASGSLLRNRRLPSVNLRVVFCGKRARKERERRGCTALSSKKKTNA